MYSKNRQRNNSRGDKQTVTLLPDFLCGFSWSRVFKRSHVAVFNLRLGRNWCCLKICGGFSSALNVFLDQWIQCFGLCSVGQTLKNINTENLRHELY